MYVRIYIYVCRKVANFLLEVPKGQNFRGIQVSKDSVPAGPVGCFETLPFDILRSIF